MAWYLNRALSNFRAAVNARWPNRDKASDGTIGDADHQARVSDHNPDPDGSVDAWDMDVDGVDVEACKRTFERHESSSYWIHNDQIAFRTEGWRRRSYAYAGPTRNRHTKHVHWNTRQSHETSTAPWIIDTGDDDMDANEHTWLMRIHQRTYAVGALKEWIEIPGEQTESVPLSVAIKEILAYARAAAERPPVTLTDAQLDALADKLAARLGGGTIALSGTLTRG